MDAGEVLLARVVSIEREHDTADAITDSENPIF
jgi:hypothetical protein